MVAYLLPVFGITLGALVLKEPIDTRLLVGTALVIGGIALVNSKYGARPLFERGPANMESAEPR
jgi:drug/metabolite transporter (DMT)-like permease